MAERDPHLDNFNNGVSRIQEIGSFEKYCETSGYIGRDSSNHPLANDINGSCFWTSSNEMDDIWKYHDHKLSEHELGFDAGYMKDNLYYRVDLDKPNEYNIRVATGYEAGANDNFTGNVKDASGICLKDESGHNIVDSQLYDKKTSSGLNECVTDKVPLDSCNVTGSQVFDNPNELAQKQCNVADLISSLDESLSKDTAVQVWRNDALALDARMEGEQNYLSQRISDHERTMSENPPDSLVYTRASENRDWCQNYYNELGESRNALEAKYNELSHGGQFHPTSSSDDSSKSTSISVNDITAQTGITNSTDNLNAEVKAHCAEADNISKMENGPQKQDTIDQWRKDAIDLSDRIGKEQDILSNKADDYAKEMKASTEGSPEYNQAQEARNECLAQHWQLSESNAMLESKANELTNNTFTEANNTANKAADNAGTEAVAEASKNAARGIQ